MEEVKIRKRTRLSSADYNKTGRYFLTMCTLQRRCTLSRINAGTGSAEALQPNIKACADIVANKAHIKQTAHPVGTGVPDGPLVKLLPYGKTAEKYIKQLNEFYDDIEVEHYVIMPNHIHMILAVKNGPSGTPVPTRQNSSVSRFVSTFKRFCNKEIGTNIWQYRSFDHIIRSRQDYEEHLKYIHQNPRRWFYDELYSTQ